MTRIPGFGDMRTYSTNGHGRYTVSSVFKRVGALVPLYVVLAILIPTASLYPAQIQASPPDTFERAKVELRQQVYHDQNQGGALGTAYCGCDWEWMGRSGGRVDHASCGYQVRAQENRAARIEWEHVVPAHSFGHQRQCWQNGGRRNCVADDPVFRAMEADMHNLTPSVGEINADRSNYRFGALPGTARLHGECDFKVNFRQRVAEPRDEIKGMFARIYFYMHDRYDLSMSSQQEQLLMAWDRAHPVTEWERERDRRIARIMGHPNPFVTGERTWNLDHRNTADGIVMPIPGTHPASGERPPEPGAPIIGNRNSGVYHLPQGCPSYGRVAPHNQVEFATEAEAQAAGLRKAGNCR